MGKLLAQQFVEARRIFEEADDALGFAISRLCFEGPDEELKKTENTQPAILTVSVAACAVLKSNGFRPAIAAGHSLGEYSALVAADCLKFSDAVRLVRKRGQYMQEAVPQGVGAMAALLKLPEEKLDFVLREAAQRQVVTAANLNSPDQVVIAGHKEAVERAMELAKAAGAKRAILLPVSAPFHCPLMQPAQERMQTELHNADFGPLSVPLINNWQARVISEIDDARQGLYEQISNPVRWTESVRELAKRGIGKFIEVGPGSVLLGLCRGIDPGLQGAKFGEPADLDKVTSAFA